MSMERQIISYSNYKLAKNEMTPIEYANSLEENFIKTKVPRMFGAESIKREDLAAILKNIARIESIRYDNINNGLTMTEELVTEYLEKQKVNPEDISYIIYTKGAYFKSAEKNLPYYIQSHFNFCNACVFSIEQECGGSLLSIELAKKLLDTTKREKALIISSNFFPNFEERLMGSTVVSDAVGIMEVSNAKKGLSSVDFLSITQGEISSVESILEKLELVATCHLNNIKKSVERNNLNLDDIKIVIPQNLSLALCKSWITTAGMNENVLFRSDFSKHGHCGDVDFIINITDLYRNSVVDTGTYMLAIAIGLGSSFNAHLFQQL